MYSRPFLRRAAGLLVLCLLVTACGQERQPVSGGDAERGAGGGELRIGALVPHTGVAATVGPEIMNGIEFVLEQAGYEVAGFEIRLIDADESDNPATAVAKARKLVEEDEVHVVIGPMLAHTSAAVAPYLARNGVPHLPWGMADSPVSADAIYTAGSGRGNAYVAGRFAAEELDAGKAALLNMDYALGHQMRDGFSDGFTAAGGEIVSNQLVPMGTSDLAPYFENLGDADVLGVLLVNPTDFAFVRQYREYGLDMPVIFISSQPQEEPLLAQMGDDVLGMYGATMYGPDIETPANRAFVEQFRATYERDPGIATMHAGYWTTALVLEAVARAGSTRRDEIAAALAGIQDFETPAGLLSIDENRMGIHDVYVFEAAREGDRYYWDVIKTYPAVQPEY